MATLDGKPVTAEQLEALANNNFGHYTSMRGDRAGVRGLTHHLTRLSRDARQVFGVDLDTERIRDLMASEIRDQDGEYGIRVTIFDPDLKLGEPSAASTPGILVAVRPVPRLPAPPLQVQVRHYARDCPTVKHTGLFGAVHERRAAQLEGFDDVLFAADDDTVTEGATWNIGFFDGDSVIWPDGDSLAGITMTLLQQVHDSTVVRPVKTTELPDLPVAFATNVTVGVRAVSRINGTYYSVDHPILETLRDEFAEIPPESIARPR